MLRIERFSPLSCFALLSALFVWSPPAARAVDTSPFTVAGFLLRQLPVASSASWQEPSDASRTDL
jgi:hypothetical protein